MTKLLQAVLTLAQVAGLCVAVWFVTRALGGPATTVTVGFTCAWVFYGIGVYAGVNRMLRAFEMGADEAAAEAVRTKTPPTSAAHPFVTGNGTSTTHGEVVYRVLQDPEEG